MADVSVTPLKRKRITTACNSCRLKKSKCDGKRPICGRCKGYSYTCTWNKAPDHNSLVGQLAGSTADSERPQLLVAVYEHLVQFVTPQFPQDVQVEVRECLATIQDRIQPHLSTSSADAASLAVHRIPIVRGIRNQRYLGNISDMYICNIMKNASETEANVSDTADEGENSESTEAALSRHFFSFPPDRLQQTEMDANLRTYFSTIHIAYPFVSKPLFMAKYGALQAKTTTTNLSSSWLSLLYALLAVGAYYNSFREDQPRPEIDHRKLFQQSCTFSNDVVPEQSMTKTSSLLAQCFYLLATSQVERCWVSLGIAIRLGQSIGLHMSPDETGIGEARVRPGNGDTEMQARLWYCLYVLDRLVALQLGRPPAISDSDCHAPIPRALIELQQDDSAAEVCCKTNEKSSRCLSDYFSNMIEFSSVIGRVLREARHSQRTMETNLRITGECDQLLLGWKERLPRHLRFDMGHLFERTSAFKRQRNMLAIKFHHLRILIHRPYLCYTHLGGQNSKRNLPAQHAQIHANEDTCVLAARSIVQLMHGVTKAEDMVMNYPWWQMMSCLVCAGSVLTLANTVENTRAVSSGPSQATAATIKDDLDMCVQVLRALSNNSKGAELALNMLTKIATRCARYSTDISLVSSTTSDQPPATPSGENGKVREGQKASDYCQGVDSGTNPSFQLENSTSHQSKGQMDNAVLDSSFGGTASDLSFGDAILGPSFGDASFWPGLVPDLMNWHEEVRNTVSDSAEPSWGLYYS